MILNLVAVKQRNLFLVELNLAGKVWHYSAYKGGSQGICLFAIHNHFTYILTQIVANSADNNIAFLEQEVGGFGTISFFCDGIPQLQ